VVCLYLETVDYKYTPPLSKAKIFKGGIAEDGAWHCSQKTDKISVILPESANYR
jgi:hypothetical protein